MPHRRLSDIHLYYETAGTGPPLVFVNGLGMNTRAWENQVRFFSERFRVITFDPRGHGRSDKPPGPYSVPLFASDTAQLLRSLEAWPAHVVGLSMGGMIAFQLAVSAPDLLKTMVIVNSGPEFIMRTLWQKFELFRRKFITRVLGMGRMASSLSKRLFPEPEQAMLQTEMARQWAENDKRAYLASLRALEGWTVFEHLSSIKHPTLVVTADSDYTPVWYKQWYAGWIPDAKLTVITNSRHATPLDQPDKFNRVLLDFLLKHERFESEQSR